MGVGDTVKAVAEKVTGGATSPAAGPSPDEQRLLDSSKTFDTAISQRDTASLKALLAPTVRVHKDGLSLKEDLSGLDAVTGWFQSFFDRYEYQSHDAIAGAADHNAPEVTFSFFVDKGVKRKDSAASPEDTVGLFYHVYDNTGKISDIWFLRQLTGDEVDRKTSEAPSQKLEFDPFSFKGAGKGVSAESAKKHHAAAETFNGIWREGNPTAADKIMVDNVVIYDPVFGNKTTGVANFKSMINNFAQTWTTKSQDSRIAVTPGDKAFVWWQNTGEGKSGGAMTLYGLNMIVFNAEGLISEVIGFRQPTE